MHLPVLGSNSFVSVSIVDNVKAGAGSVLTDTLAADGNVTFSCCSCEEFSQMEEQ
jgi:hypothetical protein